MSKTKSKCLGRYFQLPFGGEIKLISREDTNKERNETRRGNSNLAERSCCGIKQRYILFLLGRKIISSALSRAVTFTVEKRTAGGSPDLHLVTESTTRVRFSATSRVKCVAHSIGLESTPSSAIGSVRAADRNKIYGAREEGGRMNNACDGTACGK